MRISSTFFRAVLLIFSVWVAWPQGMIQFYNRSIPTADGSGIYDAPIYRDYAQTGVGREGIASLLRVKPDGSLAWVADARFRDPTWSFGTAQTFTVDGVAPGESAVFVVRIYRPGTPVPVALEDSIFQTFQSRFFRSLPLGGEVNGTFFPIPGMTGLESFAPGTLGPDDGYTNNSNFREYLKPSTNWVNPGVSDVILPNSMDLPMWRIHAAVDLIRVPWLFVFNPSVRTGAIDLASSFGQGHISRKTNVMPGAPTSLVFYLSGNPDPTFASEPSVKTLRVTVGGCAYDFTYDIASEGTSMSDMRWRKIEIPFVANSSPEEIHFESLSTGMQAGPVIDSVAAGDFYNGIPAISVQVNAAREISWNSWARFKYQVQRSASLGVEAAWVTVGSEITASEQRTSFTDPNPPSEQAFYRVILTSPLGQ